MTSTGGGDTAQQIATALADSGGIGLFAAKGWPLGGPDGTREPTQEEHGAVLIIPPQFWEEELSDLQGWLPDGFDGLANLPYGMDDIAIFAKVNFTPDVWFYVTRGPLEGKIFRWLHDDASDLTTPWADDFISGELACGAKCLICFVESLVGTGPPRRMKIAPITPSSFL